MDAETIWKVNERNTWDDIWEDPYAILSIEADPLKVDYEGPGTVMVRLRGLR